MKTPTLLRNASTVAVLAMMGQAWAASAVAQDDQADDSDSSVLFEEIMVTATKKSTAQAAQDVPIAVTAFSERQLDAMHVREISGLSYRMPNVSLDGIGTTRGTANFSIRGLGINSSIPSIDPTVGVFVDGVYMGQTGGTLFDQFDLSSVEVLRGPQGLLFGRNVTGGAVLLNTTRPNYEEGSGKVKVSYESGQNISAGAVYSGPLSDNVAFKLGAYFNDDGGWHTNLATGEDHGKAETYIIRPAIAFRPSESTEIVLRYEHGDSSGDGPSAQNHGLYSRDSFDFAIDETGSYDYKWDMASAEINIDVGFGDGTITNLVGWRKSDSDTVGDIDATPNWLFHAPASTQAEQFSNELRYSGRLDDILDITFGVFYFEQDLDYYERRLIVGGAVDISGGGRQEQSTKAAFGSIDWDISDQVTFMAGLRYTEEKKSVNIATLGLGRCNDTTSRCEGNGNLVDEQDWSNLTPKFGFRYQPDDNTQFYGFWTKGFRSGGYNLRNTSPTASPGPFDEESTSVFEVGLKRDNEDKTLRTNFAVFLNNISDMQREVNIPDPISGVVQIIDNTANARIWGLEGEIQAQLAPEIVFTANIGILDSKYKEVLFDISSDGVVNDQDLDLELPRLAPLTYGVGLMYETDAVEWGSLFASVNFNHRDLTYYTDNNVGFLNAADMLDANITAEFMEGAVAISLYGKNLLNEVTYGGNTQLPFFAGATFSPLNKGRIYGVELIYNF